MEVRERDWEVSELITGMITGLKEEGSMASFLSCQELTTSTEAFTHNGNFPMIDIFLYFCFKQ